MARVNRIQFDAAGWDAILTSIVENRLRPMAEGIAEAANASVRKQAEDALAEEDPILPAGNTVADRVNAEMKMQRRRSNRRAMHVEPPDGKRDYMVSTEGSDPLRLKDYRATVITVTERAKIDNARNNTLVRLLNGGGA